MTRYTDESGGVSFDEETVARLTNAIAEIESDAALLTDITDLSCDEFWEYLFGEPSDATLAKLRYVRFSELG
jgi:hypothetical protein